MTATSRLYTTFFGVDIAKYDFVVAHSIGKKTESFPNTEEGFNAFFAKYHNHLEEALVVLENTGGCEYALIRFLLDKNIATHRADARKVKAFIRSFGKLAKTDSIDAEALCKYAQERQKSLHCQEKEDTNCTDLRTLISRRNDLVQIQTAEKNRLKAPGNARVLDSIKQHLAFIAKDIILLTQEIEALITSQPVLKEQINMLKSIPGIGDITAQNLLAFMPELGHLGRRQVASLLGVAPIARDSGKFRGYRGTWGGRNSLRAKLFTAAMAAARSKSSIGAHYHSLLMRGKHKMVAIVAVMRKIIIIANAKMREHKGLPIILTQQLNHS